MHKGFLCCPATSTVSSMKAMTSLFKMLFVIHDMQSHERITINSTWVLSYFLLFHHCACKWVAARIPRGFPVPPAVWRLIRSRSAPEPASTWHTLCQGPWHILLWQRIPCICSAQPLQPPQAWLQQLSQTQHICWLGGTAAEQPHKPEQLVFIRILACFDNALNLHVGTTNVFLGACMHLCSTRQLNPLSSSWTGFPGYLSLLGSSPSQLLVVWAGNAFPWSSVCAVGEGTRGTGSAPELPSLLPKRAGPQRALPWPAEVFAMAAALPALSQAVAKPPEFKGISCSLSVFQQET